MADKTLWEYRVISFGGLLGPSEQEMEAGLNALGLEGWEVVAVARPHPRSKLLAFAKRPLSPTASRQRRDWPTTP